MRIREAIVVNNNDPEKKGRIQVRIMPEMESFKLHLLPWIQVNSFEGGLLKQALRHRVFEKDSLIRVLVEDDYYKKISFLSADFVKNEYNYNLFNNKVSISELGNQSYPQPNFTAFKDGTITFQNSDTGECGVFFKNGGYFLHDSSGTLVLNSHLKKIKVYNSMANLKDILKIFHEVLLGLVTAGNFTATMASGDTGPCVYLNTVGDTISLVQAVTAIENLLEDCPPLPPPPPPIPEP